MSHVLSLETSMSVLQLLKIVWKDCILHVLVRWKGHTRDDDTMKALQRVYQDVPDLLFKLMNLKSTPACLRKRACSYFGL